MNYPSHRYHPAMKEGQSAIVFDAGQDAAALAADPAWRSTPYFPEESAIYMATNPGKRVPQLPPRTPPQAPPPPLTLEALAARIDKLEAARE